MLFTYVNALFAQNYTLVTPEQLFATIGICLAVTVIDQSTAILKPA